MDIDPKEPQKCGEEYIYPIIVGGHTSYYCDPSRNTRCRKTHCFINGGPCFVTCDFRYAARGKEPTKE